MAKVFLISEQTLKRYTLINDNIDGVYIAPAIQMAQEIDLTELIGEKLVNKLCDLITSNAIIDTSNKDYKKLLDDYITPYLSWLVTANIQIAINYKLSNSGVVRNDDERKSHLDFTQSTALQTQYQHYANAYATKLTDYLCKNNSKYPEYTHCDNDGVQLCNIYLGD